ncbi:MAG: Predicted thiamin transporter PnuT [uncultured Sulfurovum sp.]|uniref:Nicotinamide riboside transporter PnuC n=1 Tax=uncultured Sulfurovum sp. TaxID=269237 RepID=A0A6S6T3N7_9BACT|nr:MAG: Predicted thiamin transporter PnuT [uncultured Sulfurovum sp.]
MNIDLASISSALLAMSGWEIVAALLGVAYVVLAAKESLWAWVFGFFSTIIYTIIFWEGALFSSSLLNFYYMVMAVYGYYSWRNGSEDKMLQIKTYPISKNLKFIGVGIVISILLGYLSTTYTDAKLAYMDAFVMVFSIIATWLLTQKVLENWIYWLVIDSVATVLYFKTGYLATVILFSIYIILAIYAYGTWKKEFNASKLSHKNDV